MGVRDSAIALWGTATCERIRRLRKAPNGARFDSPGRSGVAVSNAHLKPQRGGIPFSVGLRLRDLLA